MVVNARDTLAAVERIVWITGVRSRWTLTLRLMVVGDANGTRSTLDGVTGWTTAKGLGSLVLDAGLRLLTLGVVSAVMFLGRLAAVSVVGVTHKAIETIAPSLVLTSHTNRVCGTGEGIADSHAFKDTQNIWTTGGFIRTISVTGAVGQGRLFAG